MLSARGLTVRVGGAAASGSRTLLDDVSFELHPGQLVALLGPNGAGKSTLLRCIAGEQSPVAGETLLCDRPLTEWKPCDRARRLGVLPQNPRLAFPFTALEVVLLGRTPYCGARRPNAADSDIARDALSAVGAAELHDRLFPTLSGGEQQRVQLARVLSQLWECSPGAPRVLLLDEPLAGLDLCHQHTSLRLARDFAARGGAVLVSLHDLNQACQYADRVLVLDGGRLLADGVPHAVLTPPLIARVFATRMMSLQHPAFAHPVLVALPELTAMPGADVRLAEVARAAAAMRAPASESSTLSRSPALFP